MKHKIYFIFKYFNLLTLLLLLLCSCLEYREFILFNDNYQNAPYWPRIDKDHVNPQPDSTVDPIKVGDNCIGLEIKIPPIKYNNTSNNTLYYLWFLDRALVANGNIEAKNRKNAIISITFDQNFLQEIMTNKLLNFYEQQHYIEFVILDKSYDIKLSSTKPPYVLRKKNIVKSKLSGEDTIGWMVQFENTSCDL